MKVLCLLEPGNLVIKDSSVPKLKEEQTVIRMEMCGIYGLDVTAYRGVNPTMRYPINGLGHEDVGVIQEVRENGKGLKPGDRVTLEPYVPYNKCHMCVAGRFSNYTDLHVCGVRRDGTMSKYFLCPAQLLHKLPDELTSTHAALAEPLTISPCRAIRARVSKGEHCTVFGAGITGLTATFARINYGVIPILMDVLQKCLDCARGLGIPCIFNSGDGNVEEYLREVTDSKLPEAMIDYTGAPVILGNTHNYVCYGGRTALIGWPHDPIRINAVRLMQKEIDVCPSRDSNGEFPEAIDLVNEGRVSTDAIITKVIELDQVEGTIRDMIQSSSGYLKAIVNIREGEQHVGNHL